MKRLRVGLVGAGLVGQAEHAFYLWEERDRFEFVGLADASAAVRQALGARKIRVNTIAPGVVDTEGAHTLGVIGSDFEKQAISTTPLGRTGQPDDIGKIAVFLASDQSGWVTGSRIEAAGGYN